MRERSKLDSLERGPSQIPLQERIETVGDNADLQEVYDTERHLLYVACTRARGVAPVSEFLDDLAKGNQGPAAHG